MATKPIKPAFVLKDQLILREHIWDRIHWVTYRCLLYTSRCV